MDYSEEENEYSNYYDNHEETADSSKEIDYHEETADSSKEIDYHEETADSSKEIDYHEETADSSKEIDYHEETADSSKEKDITDDTETRLVKNAIYYLTHKTYPIGATKNEKRSIRRRAEAFVERNGEVLYRKPDKSLVCYFTLVYGILFKDFKYFFLFIRSDTYLIKRRGNKLSNPATRWVTWEQRGPWPGLQRGLCGLEYQMTCTSL